MSQEGTVLNPIVGGSVPDDLIGTVETKNDFLKGCDSDLSDVFFNSDEFAIPIKVLHTNLHIEKIYYGIFDIPHQPVDLGEINVSSSLPQIMLNEKALLEKIQKKDRITINSIIYLVEDTKSNGCDVIRVFLRKK